MAKKSGSSHFGALKKHPTFKFANSSSLITMTDGVKYGVSVFYYCGSLVDNFPKALSTNPATSLWLTLPAAETTKLEAT